jgi:hypothetical protein
MKTIVMVLVGTLIAVGMAGCVGKGKAPPPLPLPPPVITKG